MRRGSSGTKGWNWNRSGRGRRSLLGPDDHGSVWKKAEQSKVDLSASQCQRIIQVFDRSPCQLYRRSSSRRQGQMPSILLGSSVPKTWTISSQQPSISFSNSEWQKIESWKCSHYSSGHHSNSELWSVPEPCCPLESFWRGERAYFQEVSRLDHGEKQLQ